MLKSLLVVALFAGSFANAAKGGKSPSDKSEIERLRSGSVRAAIDGLAEVAAKNGFVYTLKKITKNSILIETPTIIGRDAEDTAFLVDGGDSVTLCNTIFGSTDMETMGVLKSESRLGSASGKIVNGQVILNITNKDANMSVIEEIVCRSEQALY